ncbi:type II secretion system protein [Nocardioides caeni]|uniref:PulJ/GspJ family protein n=1 Tax=Nocardioides caeni TaxID=574700 RepID=UPI0031EA3879
MHELTSASEGSGHRAQRDAGFTLMELVVTVAIIGVVTTVLSGVVIAFLKNTADTQARLTESHDVQLAAAYWQRDVSSIGVRSTTPDPATGNYPLAQWASDTACGNLPSGYSPDITLSWGEYTSRTSSDPPAQIKITYATKLVSGSTYEMVRVRCGTAASVVSVANNLAGRPQVRCDGGNCVPSATAPRIITMRLQVHDAGERHSGDYTATLTGERRQS